MTTYCLFREFRQIKVLAGKDLPTKLFELQKVAKKKIAKVNGKVSSQKLN
jgi:hypothetical protein